MPFSDRCFNDKGWKAWLITVWWMICIGHSGVMLRVCALLFGWGIRELFTTWEVGFGLFIVTSSDELLAHRCYHQGCSLILSGWELIPTQHTVRLGRNGIASFRLNGRRQKGACDRREGCWSVTFSRISLFKVGIRNSYEIFWIILNRFLQIKFQAGILFPQKNKVPFGH